MANPTVSNTRAVRPGCTVSGGPFAQEAKNFDHQPLKVNGDYEPVINRGTSRGITWRKTFDAILRESSNRALDLSGLPGDSSED